MTRNQGFSLIELLIVVVIIGIVAAIAVPNLLASRRSANEASALQSLRKINTAQMLYLNTAGNNNFGTAAQLYNSQLIGKRLAAALNVNVGGSPPTNTARDGYRFRIQVTASTPGVPATFVASAIPSNATGVTQTGTRRMCLTQTGVMKAATNNISSHYNYNQCNNAPAFVP